MPIISVDLDGVIHQYSKKYHDGTMYDPPIHGAKESLASLTADGFEIHIVTARLWPGHGTAEQQRRQIEQWLHQHGFIKGTHYHELTNNKPPAIAYIDDRAIEFQSWEQVSNQLMRFPPSSYEPGKPA